MTARRYNALLIASVCLLGLSILEVCVAWAILRTEDAGMVGVGAFFAIILAVISWLFGYALLIPIRILASVIVTTIGSALLLFDALLVYGIAVDLAEEFAR